MKFHATGALEYHLIMGKGGTFFGVPKLWGSGGWSMAPLPPPPLAAGPELYLKITGHFNPVVKFGAFEKYRETSKRFERGGRGQRLLNGLDYKEKIFAFHYRILTNFFGGSNLKKMTIEFFFKKWGT